MRKRTTALAAISAIGLVLLAVNWNGSRETREFTDLGELRIHLKNQVAEGKMSMPEAQVRLAEAIANEKKRGGKKRKSKKDATLVALWDQLKEAVEKGEITEEEAKAKMADVKTASFKKKGGKRSAEVKKGGPNISQ